MSSRALLLLLLGSAPGQASVTFHLRLRSGSAWRQRTRHMRADAACLALHSALHISRARAAAKEGSTADSCTGLPAMGRGARGPATLAHPCLIAGQGQGADKGVEHPVRCAELALDAPLSPPFAASGAANMMASQCIAKAQRPVRALSSTQRPPPRRALALSSPARPPHAGSTALRRRDLSYRTDRCTES